MLFPASVTLSAHEWSTTISTTKLATPCCSQLPSLFLHTNGPPLSPRQALVRLVLPKPAHTMSRLLKQLLEETTGSMACLRRSLEPPGCFIEPQQDLTVAS